MKFSKERELVRGCIAGDEAAWEEFVRRYGGWVRSLVLESFLRAGRPTQTGEPEELVDAVFIRLWENDRKELRRYTSDYKLTTWLRLIVVSVLWRHFRSRKPSPVSLEVLPSSAKELVADLDAPGRWEDAQWLRDGLSRLPERDRSLLELYYFREVPAETLSRIFDVTADSIRPLLSRARDRLAQILRSLSS